jgi:hypothetical protein
MLELNEMIFLGACSLLSKRFSPDSIVRSERDVAPTKETIAHAVKKSKEIWEVVVHEDRS